MPEADILQASNEDDERAPGLWPSLQLFQLKGGKLLKADYLSFIKAIVSSRTSGFMKNVLSRGIMFTCTPIDSFCGNNWADGRATAESFDFEDLPVGI